MPEIETSITHVLAPFFRRISRIHNEALSRFELRAVEAHILVALWRSESMTVSGVQKALGVRGSTLTGALDRLEKRGLLKREQAPDDRRSFRLVPVKWSMKKRKALAEALMEAEDQCYGALTARERKQLLMLIGKANLALEK